MESESLHPREESIVRRLARYQRSLKNNAPNDLSDEGLDSAEKRDLASCQRLVALLHEANGFIGEFDDTEPSAEEDDSLARIGKFELLQECGRGGFGVVFRARDTILHRDVALKVPRFEIVSSPTARNRFLDEARTAAALNHPHIVSILEADRIGPLCYIAYAYCRGPSLSQWLRDHPGPVEPRTAAALVEQIARALSLAHASSICHRDIKPANILLDIPTSPNARDIDPRTLDEYIPKLTDFGLMKLLDSPHSKTATGQLLGTVRYMSPEQAEGRTHQVGPSSDIYSLGIVLYQLLAGRLPFSEDSDLRTLMKTISEEVPTLWLDRKAAPLSVICMRCLEKEPSVRYATALELADDLKRFLEGEPIRAKGPSRFSRMRKWVALHPAISSTSVLVLVLLLIGMVEGRRYWKHLESQRLMQQAIEQAEEMQLRIARTQYAHQVRLAYESARKGDVKDAIARLRQFVPKEGQTDLRGFLWRLLWKQCWYEGEDIGEHGRAAYCSALHPNGRWLATGGAEGSLCLWDLQERKVLWNRFERGADVNAVLFSPAGDELYSADSQGALRVSKTSDGESRALVQWEGISLEAMAIIPDGYRLAVASNAGDIHLWDLDDGQRVDRWAGHRDEVNDLVVDESGRQLASASSDGTARLWDLASGQCVRVFRGHAGSVTDLAVIHGEDKLVTSGVDGTIRVWSMSDGMLLQTKQAHDARIDSLAVCPTRNLIATSSQDRTFKLWRSDSLESVASLQADSRAWSLVFDDSSAKLYSARDDGRIFVRTLLGFNAKITWPADKPYELAVSRDGESFAFGETQTTIRIQRSKAGLGEPPGYVTLPSYEYVTFCPTSESIVARVRANNTLGFWNCATGEAQGSYGPRSGVISGSISHAHHNRLVVELRNPNRVAIVDCSSKNHEVHSLGPFDEPVNAAVSSFDGTVAIFKLQGSSRGQIEIVGEKVQSSLMTNQWSELVQMSPDGTWVAAGLLPKTLLLWNYESTADPVVAICDSPINVLAFSPRESIVAAGCEDGAIRFFSVPECELVTSIQVSHGPIRSLVFSPTGEWMTVGHNATAGQKASDKGFVTHWYTHGAPLQ